MGIDQTDWSSLGQLFAAKIGTLVALVVIGLIVQWIFHRLIDKLVNKAQDGVLPDRIALSALGRSTSEPPPGSTRRVQRAKTMGSLLKSITSGIILAIVVTMMLSAVGLNIGPIIASAGIAGVALGFGSQTLVKDFLSGIFMIFEDQYGVGDVIDTGEAVGTVEEVTLRITRLRDANGVTWYVRNGEIIRVGNRSQGFATAIVDMPVSYAENVERVVGVIRETATTMGHDPDWADKFVEEPTVLGVESIVGMTMTIRTIAQCVPGENFAVQREMRERLKAALDAADVKAPPLGPFGGPVGGPP